MSFKTDYPTYTQFIHNIRSLMTENTGKLREGHKTYFISHLTRRDLENFSIKLSTNEKLEQISKNIDALNRINSSVLSSDEQKNLLTEVVKLKNDLHHFNISDENYVNEQFKDKLNVILKNIDNTCDKLNSNYKGNDDVNLIRKSADKMGPTTTADFTKIFDNLRGGNYILYRSADRTQEKYVIYYPKAKQPVRLEITFNGSSLIVNGDKFKSLEEMKKKYSLGDQVQSTSSHSPQAAEKKEKLSNQDFLGKNLSSNRQMARLVALKEQDPSAYVMTKTHEGYAVYYIKKERLNDPNYSGEKLEFTHNEKMDLVSYNGKAWGSIETLLHNHGLSKNLRPNPDYQPKQSKPQEAANPAERPRKAEEKKPAPPPPRTSSPPPAAEKKEKLSNQDFLGKNLSNNRMARLIVLKEKDPSAYMMTKTHEGYAIYYVKKERLNDPNYSGEKLEFTYNEKMNLVSYNGKAWGSIETLLHNHGLSKNLRPNPDYQPTQPKPQGGANPAEAPRKAEEKKTASSPPKESDPPKEYQPSDHTVNVDGEKLAFSAKLTLAIPKLHDRALLRNYERQLLNFKLKNASEIDTRALQFPPNQHPLEHLFVMYPMTDSDKFIAFIKEVQPLMLDSIPEGEKKKLQRQLLLKYDMDRPEMMVQQGITDTRDQHNLADMVRKLRNNSDPVLTFLIKNAWF